MPTGMRLIWPAATKNFPFEGFDIKRLTSALAKEFPNAQTRILALLSLFGSSAGLWSGFPSYEDIVEKMLLEYSTTELVTAMQNAHLSDQQVEGASRLLAGWTFRNSRPRDNTLISPDLKRMLLEHSLKSSDQDKLARARSAFQD